MPGDAAAARAVTGLHGDPAVLWVGHLDRNKDPLTVLEGVARTVADLPRLKLWCCFGSAPLRPVVEARIARDPALRGRVHLLGRVPHQQIEMLMRAADLFVLGSHREGGNYVADRGARHRLAAAGYRYPVVALAAGPGAVGFLWQRGDAHSLGKALRQGAAASGAETRARVRAHFEGHVSSKAVGRKLAAAYREIAAPFAMAANGVRA